MTPVTATLFALLLAWAFVLPGAAARAGESCRLPLAASEPLPLASAPRAVVDGDTLRLADGRLLRLVGLNTPELGRDGAADEPGAVAAREAVVRLVDSTRGLRWVPGLVSQDRHGRLLGHVVDGEGRAVFASLLAAGLAAAVSIPPDLRLRECYWQAEAEARADGAGIWSRPVMAADRPEALHPGFAVLQGRIERVRVTAHAAYLNFSGGLVGKIDKGDLGGFDRRALEALTGQRIEVRGWRYTIQRDGRTQTRIGISHPDHLRPLQR